MRIVMGQQPPLRQDYSNNMHGLRNEDDRVPVKLMKGSCKLWLLERLVSVRLFVNV